MTRHMEPIIYAVAVGLAVFLAVTFLPVTAEAYETVANIQFPLGFECQGKQVYGVIKLKCEFLF